MGGDNRPFPLGVFRRITSKNIEKLVLTFDYYCGTIHTESEVIEMLLVEAIIGFVIIGFWVSILVMAVG